MSYPQPAEITLIALALICALYTWRAFGTKPRSE